MRESELRGLLERATDRIEPADLVPDALTVSATVRRRRHAYAAGVGVAAAVAVLAASLTLGQGERGEPSPAPSPPVPTVAPMDPTDPADGSPEAPGIPDSAVQPAWDPRELTRMSSLPMQDEVALPAVLDPPAGAPALQDAWLTAAVAAVDTGEDLALVDPDGAWRRLAYPAEALDVAWMRDSTALSSDGTRVGFTGVDGIWWHDVRGGDWHRVDYPFGTDAEWDVRFEFAGTEEVLVSGPRNSYAVDLGDGRAEKLPFSLANTAASYGTSVHIYVDDLGRRRIDEWSERSIMRRSTITDSLGSLTRPATDGESLAAARGGSTGGTGQDPAMWDGLIALDLDGLTTRAFLPVRDRASYYSDNLYLGALTWVDEDTVLAGVVPRGQDWATGTQHLFTWNVETGDLARISVLSSELRPVLATDLLDGP